MTYVVIVTYGDRRLYLEKVLNYFTGYNSLQIVIVNNNSDYSVDDLNLGLKNSNVFIINSAENKGSAWGYKTGIQHASKHENCDTIWLLDDDNLPENGTYEKLNQEFYLKQQQFPKNNFALMALRADRKYLTNVASGEPVKWNFPQPNAFLGFHIFNLHFLILRKFAGIKPENNSQTINIPCAPYGGLFFHKDLVNQIGLPDERFFVYADDFEFTYRINEARGAIFLVKDAIVIDLEKTWQIKKYKKLFHSNAIESETNKVYYATRNFVYFQNKHLIRNKFIFNLNRIVYCNYLSLLSLIKGKRSNYKRFIIAVEDGLNDRFNNKNYPI